MLSGKKRASMYTHSSSANWSGVSCLLGGVNPGAVAAPMGVIP